MPFGEMTITLDDVAQILKILVVGACLYKEKDDRSVNDLLKEYLELDDMEIKEETNDSSSIKLHFLLDKFSERALKEGANEHDYEVVARAYLLYLLGCSIFCDKFGTKVSVSYLRYLDDINHLSEEAWGMGVLAYLYRQLGLASRRDVRQMVGYLTLLTVSIPHYFLLSIKKTVMLDTMNTHYFRHGFMIIFRCFQMPFRAKILTIQCRGCVDGNQ